MRESEHFNLFLAEGSDIVNPLVQDVQNYENIDTQMFKNQNAGVQNATELKNGTVHAITRNVPDAQFITFTATSNYTAGETFTVDGVQVTALTVSGETLPTGAYVINSQVLCVLKGTLLTVYCAGTKVADNSLALNGHPDTYFGTKEEVDNALDTANAAKELVNEVNNSLNNKQDKGGWTTIIEGAFASNITLNNLHISEYSELWFVFYGVSDSYFVGLMTPSSGTFIRNRLYFHDNYGYIDAGINFFDSNRPISTKFVGSNGATATDNTLIKVYGR